MSCSGLNTTIHASRRDAARSPRFWPQQAWLRFIGPELQLVRHSGEIGQG